MSIKMTAEFRAYRRRSGMAKFERECRVVVWNGRRVKAYDVPGTREAGKLAMYYAQYRNLPHA